MEYIDINGEMVPDREVRFEEAVMLTGKNRGSLSRMLKTGKIPFHTDESGKRIMRLSDLAEYPGLQQRNVEVTAPVPQPLIAATPDFTQALVADLCRQVAQLQQENRFLKEMVLQRLDQVKALPPSRPWWWRFFLGGA